MSFSSVKGLSFPAIFQHLKMQRGVLTITCAYRVQQSCIHLFLLLLQTVINSEHLSYGFRNNLLRAFFFSFMLPRKLLLLLFWAHHFVRICLQVYLLPWIVSFSRVGSGLYLPCDPKCPVLSKWSISLYRCVLNKLLIIEPLVNKDCVPQENDVKNNSGGLAASHELRYNSLTDAPSYSNRVAR